MAKKIKYLNLFKKGVVKGLGWAFGATLGFAIVSTILVFVLRQAGGLPFVGNIIASIVEATLDQLVRRTPLFPQ